MPKTPNTSYWPGPSTEAGALNPGHSMHDPTQPSLSSVTLPFWRQLEQLTRGWLLSPQPSQIVQAQALIRDRPTIATTSFDSLTRAHWWRAAAAVRRSGEVVVAGEVAGHILLVRLERA